MIKILDVNGTVITADALNCQKKTVKLIIDKGADYVLAIKKNHSNLYSDIEEIFDYILKDKVEKHKQEFRKDVIERCEKNRDRVETRTSCVLYDIDWLEGKENWSKLTAIGKLALKKEYKNKITEETRYYLLSSRFTAEELIYYKRNEWAVETMHWLLDVNLKEDECKVKNSNAQITLNIMRKIILNTLKTYYKNEYIEKSV